MKMVLTLMATKRTKIKAYVFFVFAFLGCKSTEVLRNPTIITFSKTSIMCKLENCRHAIDYMDSVQLRVMNFVGSNEKYYILNFFLHGYSDNHGLLKGEEGYCGGGLLIYQEKGNANGIYRIVDNSKFPYYSCGLMMPIDSIIRGRNRSVEISDSVFKVTDTMGNYVLFTN